MISLKQLTMCVCGKVIYVRVWEMRVGLLVVGEKGQQKSFKVTSKVISRDNGDLTKNNHQVCVWYH